MTISDKVRKRTSIKGTYFLHQHHNPCDPWRLLAAALLWSVAIVSGDAASLAHANHLVINGQMVTDPDPGDASTVPAYEPGDFDGWIIPVTVTDGTLTISAAPGAFDPTLCFIEIGQAGEAITPDMQTRLADIVESATARTGGTPFWNGNRVETRTYIWGAYVDDLVAYQRTTSAGTERYCVHSGSQYSVQAVTNAQGQVVERYAYTAYGKRVIDGPSSDGRSAIGLSIGFTGYRLDEETGLYYARHRMYAPEHGRFINRDPLGYVDGTSLYRAYFAPNGLDPTGLMSYCDALYQNMLQHVTMKQAAMRAAERCPQLAGAIDDIIDDASAQAQHFAGLMLSEDCQGKELAEIEQQMVMQDISSVLQLASAASMLIPGYGYAISTAIGAADMSLHAANGEFSTVDGAIVTADIILMVITHRPGLADDVMGAGKGVDDVANNAAHNAADFERYKDMLRTSMEKPHTINSELTGLMDELYRPGAKVGTGSTADAVRAESLGFGPTGGKEHMVKASGYARALENWLNNNPRARAGDRAAAENVLRDLLNAAAGN